MDFSKAFDKVPHWRLMDKNKYYGVNDQVASWIKHFLSGRRQRVVVDGEESAFTEVLSGVLQGTVLGPVLFLMFINDLPDDINSSARLFADDCILYRTTKSPWQMEFNPGKCYVMQVTRSWTLQLAPYLLRGHQLEVVKEAKYLGATLSDNMSWTSHISNTAAAANKTLGFLRRNLYHALPDLKENPTRYLHDPSSSMVAPSGNHTKPRTSMHWKRYSAELLALPLATTRTEAAYRICLTN